MQILNWVLFFLKLIANNVKISAFGAFVYSFADNLLHKQFQ